MASTKITVNSNGSLRVEGDFEVVDKNGNVCDLGGREVVSLCRCGMSNNKPFCDGSHKGHFEHEAVAFNLPPKNKTATSSFILHLCLQVFNSSNIPVCLFLRTLSQLK